MDQATANAFSGVPAPLCYVRGGLTVVKAIELASSPSGLMLCLLEALRLDTDVEAFAASRCRKWVLGTTVTGTGLEPATAELGPQGRGGYQRGVAR
jgi:hypothetical protein